MLSRVADSLYWMSRYLERAEHTARLVDVYLNRALDLSDVSDDRRWALMQASLHAGLPVASGADPYARARVLVFDSANESSLAFCVEAARDNARQVREQISSEMWGRLNQLFLYVKRAGLDELWEAQPHSFFQAVKEGSHLFQGITDSTMNHAEGWHFIQVGRFIERACAISALLDAHYAAFAASREDCILPEDYFDWFYLLKSCTAFEAFCKVCPGNLRPYSIGEFLLLNAEFPHSVRFSIEMVQNGLLAVADFTKSQKTGRANRLVGRLLAALNFGQIEEIMAQGVNGYLQGVQRQCAEIHSAFYQTYVSYPIDSTRLRIVEA
jgi:uncharacterized alpha-E superfamily protein